MKDPSSVLVNGDSTPPVSTLETDDDYVFTEDQRRAALELQSLYRKLGLEDLDDGFEEGLSAYDDPHFDIVARLHEVNTRFQEDETPLESDRNRKVRFKETVVDLVVPISPVRNTFAPSDLDYADYDDEYDDDFETEELRNMMADDDLNPKHSEEEEEEEEEEEAKPESWLPLKPSAPPLLFLSSGDSREDDETSHDNDIIHIRAIADDDSDRSNCSSPEKMLKLENDSPVQNPSIPVEGDSSQTEVERLLPNEPEVKRLLPNEPEVKGFLPSEPEVERLLPEVEQTVPWTAEEVNSELHPKSAEEEQQDTAIEQPDSPETSPEVSSTQPPHDNIISDNREEDLVVPYDKQVLPMGAKPKKPYRTSSPPCKPRTGPKKPTSPLPRQSVPVLDVRSNGVASTKCGNSRSKYGLTEELRQELRRLKQLELTQKKMREQEIAEEKRKRQEEAESAFKAWLEMKRRSKASSPTPRKETSRSPTRKAVSVKGQDPQGVVPPEEREGEAFQVWIESKHRQDSRERLLLQIHKQQEAIVADSLRGRRDSSRKAYRAWLRRKNVQRRQQTLQAVQQGALRGTGGGGGGGAMLSATFPQTLPRVLQQAQILNRTYQAYLGSTLWAVLAGLKRHPAAHI